MKKFFAVLCMITCIFGLTACGKQEAVSAATENNIEVAKFLSTEFMIPYMSNFFQDDIAKEYLAEYDKEEMEYIFQQVFINATSMYAQYGMDMGVQELSIDGSGILGGVSSFNSAYDAIGDVVELGEATAEVHGDEIIITVPVTGTNKNANAEVIFSNDLFLTIKACALNVESSFGELMEKAALNTLLGMGTVFVVLILISFIISLFAFLPKPGTKKAGKSSKEEIKKEAVDNTIAQIIEKEEAAEMINDHELVAVIAAAIAASEGAATTDGFFVRSIRKVRR